MRASLIMKKLILRGTAVVVPFALTAWVLVTVFGSIDAWIDGYLQMWFNFSFPGFGILLLIGSIFVAGILTQTAIGTWFYNLVNKIVFKVPLINKIYKLIKETVDMITTKQAFKTVVKVEFPKVGVTSIGFLTNENTVFIPTTPNPTSGFLIKTDQYEIVDMSVEDALRYIVSMGTIK
jgi:uncharacterized membrane protein